VAEQNRRRGAVSWAAWGNRGPDLDTINFGTFLNQQVCICIAMFQKLVGEEMMKRAQGKENRGF
jgi:hypothetical protein